MKNKSNINDGTMIAKMAATSNHRVVDRLSSKKINYAVIVSCAVIKQPNN